jgi:hypothetical protein
MAPVPNTLALNLTFPPSPSVLDTPYTNIKSSTIIPEHMPKNIISHAVFLQDTEPLDPSFKRILEFPNHPPIHLRSIAETQNLENNTSNTTSVHGKLKLQTGMSTPTITFLVISVVVVVGIIGCDVYRRCRQRLEMKKQQEEERWESWNAEQRKERIEEGELFEIDLGGLDIAVVEHVEYAGVESVRGVPKERRKFGPGWMRFWR